MQATQVLLFSSSPISVAEAKRVGENRKLRELWHLFVGLWASGDMVHQPTAHLWLVITQGLIAGFVPSVLPSNTTVMMSDSRYAPYTINVRRDRPMAQVLPTAADCRCMQAP